MDVMVECLRQAAGLVYFRPYWDRLPLQEGIRFVAGEVGDAVVTVLGCQGTNPEQAAEYAEWRIYREQFGDSYPDMDALRQFAREAGHFD